jgi:hypothetical protein
MSDIVIRDGSVGTVTINYKTPKDEVPSLTKQKDYAIKSLAALQLLFATTTEEEKEYFSSAVNIMCDAIQKISDIDKDDLTEDDDGAYDHYN